MTTIGSSGFGKCGELATVGTDHLSIAICAKGGFSEDCFQFASAMAPKSLIQTLFPLFSSIQDRQVCQALQKGTMATASNSTFVTDSQPKQTRKVYEKRAS